MINVLFVDDEPNVLASIKRMLRSKHNEWSMAFAGSGAEALALFEETAFDVVISDIRMPGMDGIELLGRIKDAYPGVIRIALSGQVDLSEVMRSFQAVHQYMAKPCDAEIIVNKVESAIDSREILTDRKMQNLVTEIDSLPVIPKVFQAIEEELRSNDPSIQKIAQMISMDVGLLTRILKLVNSPYFGLPSRIVSIAQAITLLGVETIKTLILSTHLFSMYDDKILPKFSLNLLWDHSFRVSNIARLLAQCEGMNNETIVQVRMAGLLHDVGKLILVANFPKRYGQVFQKIASDTCTISECEQEVFGTTHAHLGAYLMGLWGMSSEVVRGIGLHHGYAAYDLSVPMFLSVADTIDHHCMIIHPKYVRPKLGLHDLPESQRAKQLEKWMTYLKNNWEGVEEFQAFDADMLELLRK